MNPLFDPARPIRVRHLKRSFGRIPVLKGASFEVHAGERLCLVGSNGSGKSTLMSILAGLRRPDRDSGEVSLYGLPPTDPELKRWRAVQLERPHFPYYSKVGEIAWLFSHFCPDPRDVDELLQRFRLRPDAFIRHLSKGQKQRLAIGLALLMNPQLLLLDEPTSGLDPQARIDLWQIVLHHLQAREDRTLFFITHEMDAAEQWADRVAILHDGRIAVDGRPGDLCKEFVGSFTKIIFSAEDGRVAHEEIGAADSRHLIHDVVTRGSELIVYTDHARELVGTLPLDRGFQVRIEPVSLQDVFLRVTGEVEVADEQRLVVESR